MIFRFVIAVSLFFISLSAAVTLERNVDHYDDFAIASLYDPSGSMTIDEAVRTPFPQLGANRFTYGYLSGARWFQVTLVNRSDSEHFILRFNEVLWKHMDLYRPEGAGWVKEANGLDVPLSQRGVSSVLPTFALDIAPGTQQTYYLRGETVASQLGSFDLFSADVYYQPTRVSITHIYIMFAIILLSIALLNGFNYLLTRESIYLYYIGYILAFVLFSAMQSGIYLLFGLPGWNGGLHIVGALVVISLLLFSDRFLDLERVLPSIHYFFRISIGVFALFIVLIHFNVAQATMFFNFYSILFFTALFVAAVQVMLRGSNSARYYLIALAIYTPMMGLMILTFNTFLDYGLITRHSYLLGALIEIFFFTLILTSRYRKLSQEKIRIQDELLSVRAKQQEHLESEIEKQTRELRESNDALSRAQTELRQMALTDNLTGLCNRNKMDELLDAEYRRAIRYKQPFSLILIDIDHFKMINDTHGHLVGDRVLIDMARRMEGSVRVTDSVSRWGGEEFLILCPGITQKGAMTVAEGIRETVESEPFEGAGRQTVSLGVAQYLLGDTVFETIRHADEALYRAKRQGRNSVAAWEPR